MNRISDKIVNATIRLLIQNGIRKTTMDEIAETSMVSKVTVYKYFTDKDALYLEICRSVCSEYAGKLAGIASCGDPLEKRLFDYLCMLGEFSGSGKFELCAELARHNQAAEEEYERYRQTYRRSMLALIDEGLQKGLIRQSLDREMVFAYVDMGVAYHQQNREYRKRMAEDEAFRRRFLLFQIGNIFVDGVALPGMG